MCGERHIVVKSSSASLCAAFDKPACLNITLLSGFDDDSVFTSSCLSPSFSLFLGTCMIVGIFFTQITISNHQNWGKGKIYDCMFNSACPGFWFFKFNIVFGMEDNWKVKYVSAIKIYGHFCPWLTGPKIKMCPKKEKVEKTKLIWFLYLSLLLCFHSKFVMCVKKIKLKCDLFWTELLFHNVL